MRTIKRVLRTFDRLLDPPKQDHLVVLAYHSVSGLDDELSTPPDMFEAQLRWLSDNGFRSPSFRESVDALTRSGSDRIVVLTFDDAYEDFLTDACPLLERYGFKAIVFVPSGLVGKTVKWSSNGFHRRVMSWSQIQQICDRGMYVGNHTADHAWLSGVSEDYIASQILDANAAFAGHGLSYVSAFCAPYGVTSPELASFMAQGGFELSFGGREGVVVPGCSSAVLLPRVSVNHRVTMADFSGYFRSRGKATMFARNVLTAFSHKFVSKVFGRPRPISSDA